MDYKCENQGRSIPKYLTWVKWPIWRTPLACSNSRLLSIVYTSTNKMLLSKCFLSKEIHPNCLISIQAKVILQTLFIAGWYQQQKGDPWYQASVLWSEVITMLGGSSLRHSSSNTKVTCSLFFRFALKWNLFMSEYLCLCNWGRYSGVCDAQRLWIGILVYFNW